MKFDRPDPTNPECLEGLQVSFDRAWSFLRGIMVFLGLVICAGSPALAATLNANFNSASEIPVTAVAYAAKGKSLKLSLGFAPDFGTDLRVIENTGIGFITGTFVNLSQGEEISVPYDGVIYRFVANYFGGSGNDLVLLWPHHAVFTWGENPNGQLGDHSFTNRMAPVEVDGSGGLSGKTVLAIDGGGNHGIAACSDGSVWAWGLNTSGELGDGSKATRAAPVRVKRSGVLSGKRVIAVSAGYSHSLALCSDGTLAAWGNNDDGQLGDGSNVASAVPVRVDATGVLAGKTVVAISAGYSHNLALCSNGVIVAWGANIHGELGNASRLNRNKPVLVRARGALVGKSVVGVSAGTGFSVALFSDGTVANWGGYSADSDLPVFVSSAEVLKGKKVVTVCAGDNHCVALCSDGTVLAWGDNSRGQLGNDSTLGSSVPVRVSTAGALAVKKVIAVQAGGDRSLALCSDGTATSWGCIDSSVREGYSLVPVLLNDSGALVGRKARLISSGTLHGLVVSANPSSSELRNLTTNEGSLAPLFSPEVTDYFLRVGNRTSGISLTPAAKEAALVRVNGRKVVSGTPSGEIPLTSGLNRIKVRVAAKGGNVTEYVIMVQKGGRVDIPIVMADDVPYLGGATDFSAFSVKLTLGFHPPVGTNLKLSENSGSGFITGLFTNLAQGQKVDLPFGGIIYHFVANYYGGTGNDLVLEWAQRKVYAWGRGDSGQLGNNGKDNSPVPVALTEMGALSGKTVVQVAGGSGFSLARCVDGTLAAWGSGGNLGDGTHADSSVPVEVIRTGALAGKRVTSISAASGTSLAVCSDGTMASWGFGGAGQLGNGSTESSTVPVAVNTMGALAGKFVVAARWEEVTVWLFALTGRW